MPVRTISLLLASISLVAAEKPSPPPATVQDLRALLDDPNGDLARLATQFVGKDGGNQLFYFPTHDEPSNPAEWGLKYEVINFKSSDGTPLHGWFIPAKNEAPQTAKATVVFSHGNAGSVSYHLGFCAWLAETGYNVMVYDYRGFGKSGGKLDRRGMINDVKAAFSYIRKRPDIDTKRLISYGHSLGGAKSITALGESPVKGLRAIVIDGTFASYQAMAEAFGGQLGASLVSDELAPKDFISKLTPVPLLVVHGTKDEVVPFAQGKQLYKAAGQPKTLFVVPSGRHGTALSADNGAYRKKMSAWLDQVLKD